MIDVRKSCQSESYGCNSIIYCIHFDAGYYSAFIYGYNIIQCPMEIIHGRQSSLHNVAAGGLLGYIGVTRGGMGVPFVSPYFLYGTRHPGLIGAAVVRNKFFCMESLCHATIFVPNLLCVLQYGGIGGVLATIGGKPL